MTATTASDATGPVEYFFDETTGGPGAMDSGWQTSTNYTDSGLDAGTEYTYTVQSRDSVTPTPNTGTASAGSNATTTGCSATTLFTDEWESGDDSAWDGTSACLDVTTGSADTGTYGADYGGKCSATKNVSTAGYTNIHIIVSWRPRVSGSQELQLFWNDGTWNTEPKEIGTSWETQDYALPSSCDDLSTFKFQVKSNKGGGSNVAYVDKVTVTGIAQ
jgi:hypothetical protein